MVSYISSAGKEHKRLDNHFRWKTSKHWLSRRMKRPSYLLLEASNLASAVHRYPFRGYKGIMGTFHLASKFLESSWSSHLTTPVNVPWQFTARIPRKTLPRCLLRIAMGNTKASKSVLDVPVDVQNLSLLSLLYVA
jgi:hypothetical protein